MFQSQSWPNLWYFLFRFLKSCMDNKKPLLLLNIDSMPSRRGGSGLYFFFIKKKTNRYVVFLLWFFFSWKIHNMYFFSWMCFIKISLVTSFRIVPPRYFFPWNQFFTKFFKANLKCDFFSLLPSITRDRIFGSLYSLFSI